MCEIGSRVVHGGLIFILFTLSTCRPPIERQPFYRIQFHGETGWILGAVSYMSSDSGNHWQKMFPRASGNDAAAIGHPFCLVNEKIGVSAPDRRLMVTSDGGVTWKESIRTKNLLVDPFFMIEPFGLGFACDRDLGAMCRTQDGGRNWQEIEAFGHANLHGLALWNNTIYGLVGWKLFKSTDRGLSWSNVREFTDAEAMSLVEDRLWFVGLNGMCTAYELKTGTVQDFPLNTQCKLNGIAGSETTLIAIGSHGSLFVSVVYPPVWRLVPLGRTDSLMSVGFAPDRTAFVVGGVEEGAIIGWPRRLALKSRDYKHWEEVELLY